MSGVWRPEGAEQLEAVKGAWLCVIGACGLKRVEPLEAAMDARL